MKYTKLSSTKNDLTEPKPNTRRKSSLRENILSDEEKYFLEFVAKGDIDSVKRLLDINPGLNIRCVDFQGDSALHLALKSSNDKMVDFLLKRKDLDVMDCALHAIRLNQPRNVTLILDKLKKIEPTLEYSPCINSTDFPEYLTPLMLAAKCGYVEIINLLLDRGHPPIAHPHPIDMCEECVLNLTTRDSLIVAASKLEVYKAICNPAYICITTNDPILLGFQLVKKLKREALRNRVYLRKYQQLLEDTEQFAADLIGLCRTSNEVNIVLNEKRGSNLRGHFLFPRLILAMDTRQKQFIAQTNVQEVLETAWVGDWHDWKSFPDWKRLLHFLGRIFMLPIVLIVCVAAPGSDWATFYSIPLNRMLNSVASYLIFLGLLFWESDQDKKNQTRYQIQYHTGWQLLIFIFVVSHVLSSFRMMTLQGVSRFLSFKWNIYDLVMEAMFTISCVFWFCALFTMYWQPDIERKYWHYLDPQLLAEGFFCIGTVMAYSRLLLLIQIHSTLGPMQVSLGKMTKDFSQFAIIFAIVIGSFTAGMCRLYEYYDGMKQIDPDTNAESRQESSFVSAYDTFKVLFWGLFCMSSQDAGSVVIENLPTEGGDLESINSHDFTQTVGYTLFGVYTVLTVIVLLNMLIAAMSNTFQRVTDNVDTEWIFGRTEVYLAYMSQTVLPPPLSFFPTQVGVKSLTECFKKIFTSWFSQERDVEADEKAEEQFDNLMAILVSRYLGQKNEIDMGL